MATNSRLGEDLSNHFNDRLRLLLQDTADTMRHTDLDGREAAAILLAGLLGEAVMGSRSLGADEELFLKAWSVAFRGIEAQAKKASVRRKKTS